MFKSDNLKPSVLIKPNPSHFYYVSSGLLRQPFYGPPGSTFVLPWSTLLRAKVISLGVNAIISLSCLRLFSGFTGQWEECPSPYHGLQWPTCFSDCISYHSSCCLLHFCNLGFFPFCSLKYTMLISSWGLCACYFLCLKYSSDVFPCNSIIFITEDSGHCHFSGLLWSH